MLQMSEYFISFGAHRKHKNVLLADKIKKSGIPMQLVKRVCLFAFALALSHGSALEVYGRNKILKS